MKIKIITISLLLTFSSFAWAQSVEEFILMVKEYNPELKSIKLSYEAALQKADQVNDWPDPTVNLGLGILPVQTRLGAQRFRIGATQMIPWKGLLVAKSDIANLMAEEKSYDDEIRAIDIEYAIRNTYQNLLFLEDQKQIIAQRIEILDIMEELGKSALRSGKGQLSNILMVERKRESFMADLQLIDAKKKIFEGKLNIWADRDKSTPIGLISNNPYLIEKQSVLDYAEKQHPVFTKIQSQIATSIQTANITDLEAKPKIGVGLEYAWISKRKDVEIPGNGRDVLMPMVSVSIPLNTSRFEAIRREEAVKQDASRLKMVAIADNYRLEVETAYTEMEFLNQVIEKYQGLQSITEETLELMRTEYATEGTRFEELLRLEMELVDYDYQILETEYQLALKEITLLKYK